MGLNPDQDFCFSWFYAVSLTGESLVRYIKEQPLTSLELILDQLQ